MKAPKTASKGLPIRPGHILYPMLAMFALVGILFGSIGHHVTEDMPESETHPYFPDHIWPYPVLAMAALVSLGLLSVFGQPALQLGQAADPRVVIIPSPEWYFLSIFQFVKLGPALVTSIIVPTAVVIGLILWPLIDARLGPKLARRLGWRSWPVPKRNNITGTLWLAGLGMIGLLTVWAALWPQLCIPWLINGPVCGG
jgi:quinol-cytochrome oxidoreductase complex cytochrome b subunit